MKTTNRAHDAAHYAFQPDEPILIDANVWLYLQPPAVQPGSRLTAAYSKVYERLLKAKAQPVVDALVLSEYLNRYLRLEYDAAWRSTYPQFKVFRRSVEGIRLAQAAAADVRRILQSATPQDTPLSRSDLSMVLEAVEAGGVDFNDGILIESCRLQGWKLLTHDGDMSVGGIDVLTTNRRLLQLCV